MQDKLNQFINTWTGILCGDTTLNTGQCTGLSEVWMDNLNLNTPHEYGNACDLLTNANTNNFDVIYNTPSGFPLPGDIMVWGTSWGGGYGHTGVIVTADVNSFTCFEQNNPTGHAPQINGHSNYNGVLGWLHSHWIAPIITPPPLEGLAIQVGYNPTFEGQDVTVGGVHYKSIKVDNVLVWKIEPPQPQTPIVEPPVSPQTASTASTTPPVTVSTANLPPVITPVIQITFWQRFLNFLKSLF